MRHKTKPFHILDLTLWPIIIILWESFSIKHAHFWHWHLYENNNLKYLNIDIEENAMKPIKNIFDVFFKLNLEWNKCIILKPRNFQGEFRIGYNNKREQKLSSIVLNNGEVFAMLLAPGENRFFALSIEDDSEIDLGIVGYDSKYNLRQNKITLY